MSGQVAKWSSGRMVTTIVMFLLIGVAGTTLTSLACFLYMPVTTRVTGNGISGRDAMAARPRSVNFKASDLSTGVGVTMRMDYWYWVTDQHSPMAVGLTTCAVGWPMHAFESPDPGFAAAVSQADFARAQTTAMSRSSSSKLPTFLGARPYRAFPTAIRPLGLAVNALTFAAVSALVWFGWSAFRAARRKRAGRCVSCGYPLGQLERCPECGWARFLRLIAHIFGQGVRT